MCPWFILGTLCVETPTHDNPDPARPIENEPTLRSYLGTRGQTIRRLTGGRLVEASTLYVKGSQCKSSGVRGGKSSRERTPGWPPTPRVGPSAVSELSVKRDQRLGGLPRCFLSPFESTDDDFDLGAPAAGEFLLGGALLARALAHFRSSSVISWGYLQGSCVHLGPPFTT